MGAIIGLVFMVIWLAIVVGILAGLWKCFEKMGRKGWEGIVPIYNFYVLLQVLNQPAWMLIGLLIPLVNIVFLVLICIEVAKGFGKDTVYGVLLALFGFVLWPILGFGPAKWNGSQAKPGFGIIPVGQPAAQ